MRGVLLVGRRELCADSFLLLCITIVDGWVGGVYTLVVLSFRSYTKLF